MSPSTGIQTVVSVQFDLVYDPHRARRLAQLLFGIGPVEATVLVGTSS